MPKKTRIYHDSWDAVFTNRPRACNLGGDFWITAEARDEYPSIVNIKKGTCTCARFPNCRHLLIAKTQRRFIIRSGYAIRDGRNFIMPDADRLVIAQLKRVYGSLGRVQGG